MMRKIIKYILIVVVVVSVVVIGVLLLSEKPPARHAMPNPNGYDDFVKAGKLATPILYTNDYRKMSREELASVVSNDAEALKLVRIGLSHECRVPDDYSPDYVARRLAPVLPGFKSLVFLICAEGRLAELEGRTNDAIKIYIDGIHFGQESSRGGLLISKFVGIGCEAISSEPLEALVYSVDAQQSRKLAHALETLDAAEPPFAEVLDEQKRLNHKVDGFFSPIMAFVDRKDVNYTAQSMKANELHRRNLMISFAARAYELEHGKRPQSIAELVPSYLKAIPQDPTTGTNLVYSQ